MESVLGRYRNLIVLVAVLFAQVLGLAVQVKRTTNSEPTRLIRIWAVGAVSPLEKALLWIQASTNNVWRNYLYLRGVRAENRELRLEIEQMRLEQARMTQDADQARRLQALFSFKEQFISKTLAAQVIGSSGSEQSRSIYIDKGARDGIKADMAVITKDGIVGKVLQVFGTNPLEASTAQVLLINDQTSGVGAILEKSRLQGILRGTPSGELMLEKVMSDENVPAGELVLTSGGDSIFPKGLPIGSVTKVSIGSDLFLNIRVRAAADLSRLEEVLVVTKIDERQAQPEQTGPIRAADILAERLPSVPVKTETATTGTGKPGVGQANGSASVTSAPSTAGSATTAKPKSAAGAATASTISGSTTTTPKAGSSVGSGDGPANGAGATRSKGQAESPGPDSVVVQGTETSPANSTSATGTGATAPASSTPARAAKRPADSAGPPNPQAPTQEAPQSPKPDTPQ